MAQQINLYSWTASVQGIGFEDGFTGLAGRSIRVNAGGTGFEYFVPGTGTVTSVAATTPLASSGGATPTISLGGLSAFGSVGQAMRVASGGATLEWFTPTTGTVTTVSGTAPIISSGGATPAISLAGLTTVGSANQFPMSGGTTWSYVGSTGSGSVVRATSPTVADPTFTGTTTTATLNVNGVATFDQKANFNADIDGAGAITIAGDVNLCEFSPSSYLLELRPGSGGAGQIGVFGTTAQPRQSLTYSNIVPNPVVQTSENVEFVQRLVDGLLAYGWFDP